MSKRLLCLDMGGTIAQVRHQDGDRLGYQEQKVARNLHIWDFLTPTQQSLLHQIAPHEYQLLAAKDSTDVGPDDWLACARSIFLARNDFSGFVITHGTDTLTYTAAALSFMLCDLDRPIAITASQIPIQDPKTFGRSDGWNNLVSAFKVAAASPLLGVCVVFGSKILRGSRVRKVHSFDFDAFESPNVPPLGYIGVDLKYPPVLEHPRSLYIYDDAEARFRLSNKVGLIKIFPGMRPSQLSEQLKTSDAEGFVLEAFGSGWLPMELLAVLSDEGHDRVIVVTVETSFGPQEKFRYEPTYWANEPPFVSGRDMTTHAALVKLMWALGQTKDRQEIRHLLEQNIAGEVTPGLIQYHES